MNIKPIQFNENSLKSYSGLFARCFPPSAKFGMEGLNWLYTKNPAGNAVGFDAWEGDELAAHYVCIPTIVSFAGTHSKMLLSLNTATHPSFQGRGLFTKLAQATYDAAAALGFDAVHGVANANSTPGFIRKLGFKLVQPLEARVGVGSLDVDVQRLKQEAQFQRVWTSEHLNWRCANPVNRISPRSGRDFSQFFAEAKGRVLSAYAQLESAELGKAYSGPGVPASPLRLFLGLYPAGACNYARYISIPQRFRPSPLNFIFRPLKANLSMLESGAVAFSFLDFDAY
ncbi:GNAT family N-acetyltransferase [Achromobacter marplatensis]|uniref:GNAT family N-acetyltransferase n=1 Tax=Achromobacter marplatensis TaxID=470868 RepID=UPI0039F6EF85